MTMYIIIMTVMMAGGAPQQVKMETRYDSIAACEAAKARAVESYEQQNRDAKVEKAECTKA